MYQFTRDHGKNKKGDKVEYYEIDHIDYLLRVGVLEEIQGQAFIDSFKEEKPAKKTTKKKDSEL